MACAVGPRHVHIDVQAAILWLAVDEARGHLMRAHLARGILRARGLRVDIVTTAESGARFLAAMGTPAIVLSRQYRLAFDARHGLDPAASLTAFRRYAFDLDGLLRDLLRLRRWRHYDLLVNDSFHPALLLAAPFMPRSGARVVHVYAEHLRTSVEDGLEAASPSLRHAFTSLCRGAFAHVEHGLHTGPDRDAKVRVVRLPPLIAAPSRDRDTLRLALGVHDAQPLAVLYANPHFRDARLADALVDGLARGGAFVHAVGEGFAGGRGWLAHDPALTDAIAAADVFASGPGMGALGHVAAFGVPFVGLLGRQPEQMRNAGDLPRLHVPHAIVDVCAPDLRERVARAVAHVRQCSRPAPDPTLAPAAVHRAWADAFVRLVSQSRRERSIQTCTHSRSIPTASRSSSRPTT